MAFDKTEIFTARLQSMTDEMLVDATVRYRQMVKARRERFERAERIYGRLVDEISRRGLDLGEHE